MEPETLWRRYSAIWSADPERREAELAACLADGATYCDPVGRLAGREALSAYIADFQKSVPGGAFDILEVHAHTGRSLARWALRGPNGDVLQRGASFAVQDETGRLKEITGFFPLVAAEPER
jgi:hypothetical protein